MPLLVTGMRNKQGFSLIEILVVLVIIGITLTFTVLAFGDFGKSKRVLFSADQFVNSLKLAQQQAILEQGTFGVSFSKNSYQILRYNPEGKWQTVSNKGIFKEQFFPKETVFSLKSSVKKSPQVMINSSGDLTPFVLDLGYSRDEVIVVIKGRQDGVLVVDKVGGKG